MHHAHEIGSLWNKNQLKRKKRTSEVETTAVSDRSASGLYGRLQCIRFVLSACVARCKSLHMLRHEIPTWLLNTLRRQVLGFWANDLRPVASQAWSAMHNHVQIAPCKIRMPAHRVHELSRNDELMQLVYVLQFGLMPCHNVFQDLQDLADRRRSCTTSIPSAFTQQSMQEETALKYSQYYLLR